MNEDEGSTRNNVEEVHGQLFEVGPRYVNLSYIGEGAYGMVALVLLTFFITAFANAILSGRNILNSFLYLLLSRHE